MRRLYLLLLAAACAAPAAAQDQAPSAPAPPSPPGAGVAANLPEPDAALPAVPDIEARLASLHPSQPMDYFRLAEEVAAEAAHPDHYRLARTLYVLAMALHPTPATADLTPSVCLGLAAIAVTPDEAHWLRAMADALTRRDRLEPDWSPPGPEASPEQAALDLATAIGLIRAGEGARAEPLMNNPAVRALLRKHEWALRISGMTVGELQRHLDVWRHCPECFQRGLNQRVVSSPNGYLLCPTCGGNPGPVLTLPQLIGQLRFESLLLDGVNRSWSAQFLVDGGAPLRDLDPGEIPGTYGVHPDQPFWRRGRWVPDPSAPPPPEAREEQPAGESPAPAEPQPDVTPAEPETPAPPEPQPQPATDPVTQPGG